MSYQVIARKYRPQTFDELTGQRLLTDTLKNAITTNRVAHGYIFSGARGVGKTTTARIFAKALNCIQGPTVTPCGVCPSCMEIAAGNSVDVLEIDAASNRGIDEIRELRETVRYLPARDRYKVFIIDEAHMLTNEAFNALLKTLEEPPPRSLFILATTEAHKLPSTIQSRCQHFAFRLLDYAEIYSRLAKVSVAEKIEADEGALSVIAQAAEGSLRDALSLLDQVIAACGEHLEEGRVRQVLGIVPSNFLTDTLAAIQSGDARGVLERVSELASQGYDLGHFCGEFARFIRNLAIAKACGADSPLLQVSSEARETLAEFAKLFSEEDLARFFQILLRTEGEMRHALQPRFHLELGLMKLVHARRLASLETLLGELGSAGPAAKPAGATVRSSAPDPPSPAAPKRPAGEPRRESAPTALPSGTTPVTKAAAVTTRAAAPALSRAVAPARASAEDSRLDAIKSLLFGQSKLLTSCLEPVIAWRFENGEVRFLYAKKDSWAAELLKTRERLETLRSVCSQVLGQPVKICVTLEESAAESPVRRPSARERAERDPGVEAFRKRFDCTLVDVTDLSQE